MGNINNSIITISGVEHTEKTKYTLNNILNYIQGNVRYQLYYSKFAFLIPIHIREQIDARINSMDGQCYSEGQCKMCGCSTTALQMCDKACDKPCYPPMLNKAAWEKFKSFKYFPYGDIWWKIENIEGKAYFAIRGGVELFKKEDADILTQEISPIIQLRDKENLDFFKKMKDQNRVI